MGLPRLCDVDEGWSPCRFGPVVCGPGELVPGQARGLDETLGWRADIRERARNVQEPGLSDVTLYRRLLQQCRPYWVNLLCLLLLGFLGGPLGLLMPLPLKLAVDGALGGRPLPP